jgi:presqualene diphosphate synthase
MVAVGNTSAKTPAEPAAARSSFYTALRILPANQREAMFQVYAFCRAVDDIADAGGPRQNRLLELESWRSDLENFYMGSSISPRLAGLQGPINRFGLAQADFGAIIDGMVMDTEQDMRAPDWATLDLYCDRVASAVGRLSVCIFGVPEVHRRPLAHHLGRALQLTNILRDIDEDAGLGRLYLPREALLDAGIPDVELARVLGHPNIDAACAPVVERVRSHFAESAHIMEYCPRTTTRSPRIMAAVYGGILDELVARGFLHPRKRVSVAKSRMLWAILRHGLF